jgi:hypothetical protein
MWQVKSGIRWMDRSTGSNGTAVVHDELIFFGHPRSPDEILVSEIGQLVSKVTQKGSIILQKATTDL